MSNPVLIELTRGGLVESRHAGALALARPTGALMLSLGDVETPVFPRSAVKMLQCLPLIETGAAHHFGFGEEEIALACASHSGSERHTSIVARMLAAVGLSLDALGCGAHEPSDSAALRKLVAERRPASALHNNCSGKHAAMLATAAHCDEPTAGYWQPDHPVQVRIRGTLEELMGCMLGPSVCGIDGCSVPTWAVPLAHLARGFARFVSGEGAGAAHRPAAERIASACWAAPELVAGEGRLDTEVMRGLPGQVLMKTGAEGVYCAALAAQGVGLALKIDDGSKRASEALVMHVLARLVPAARQVMPRPLLKNWRGLAVGEIRASPVLLEALDALKP